MEKNGTYLRMDVYEHKSEENMEKQERDEEMEEFVDKTLLVKVDQLINLWC